MKRAGCMMAALALTCAAALACAEGVELTPTPGVMAAASATAAPEESVALPDGLGERILQFGMKGDDVALMQRRLIELGYYDGEEDGSFGRRTRSAVFAFQRAHGLAKIDGKAGPETLGRMFAQDAIARPTPTPSPTPKPTPSPTPSPTPTPSPAPSATPDMEHAPFEMAMEELRVGGNTVTLAIGRDEQGEALYPLCGALSHLGFEYAYAAGSWQFARESDGAELALMTDGQDGLCAGALCAVDGVIFLTDEARRLYVYGTEAYGTQALLEAFGVRVLPLKDMTILQ